MDSSLRRGTAIGLGLLLGIAGPTVGARAAEPWTVTGVLRASERIELRTDLAAAVAEVARREGEAFESGDALIVLDCARQRADHAAAAARAKAADAEARQIAHLHGLGAAGSGEMRVSRARSEAARAEASAHATRLSGCTIAAPFAGRVVGVRARAHSVPERGAALMEIVGRTPPEIEMVAPSDWLRWLRVGTALRFEVRETGTVLAARVTRLGAHVDPSSRTIAVWATPDANAPGILAGMTGTATFEPSE